MLQIKISCPVEAILPDDGRWYKGSELIKNLRTRVVKTINKEFPGALISYQIPAKGSIRVSAFEHSTLRPDKKIARKIREILKRQIDATKWEKFLGD